MRLTNYLNRPEYFFRPGQIYHRILHFNSKKINNFKNVLLPWGTEIKIPLDPEDRVGRSIRAHGIYDLSITEALWRLIAPRETAVDIGANIGYMTSIMVKKVGKAGKVWCFEPNPEVYEELCENIRNWQETRGWQQISPQKIALSNQPGVGLLKLPTKNRGEASLVSPENVKEIQANKKNELTYTVTLARLDEVLKDSGEIGVVKIDVEGHELEVLQGTTELIYKHYIRDILFEEHRGYPSPVTEFLEEHGYTIFRIWKGFWGPLLKSPTKNLVHPWEPPNYLATQDTRRAIDRFKKRGWYSLSGSRF
ncbi:MAG: FkbM family methyltransferase [Coleofasciculaceae cyanobacterium]